MEQLLEAVRGYFAGRNAAWVTGDYVPALAAARAQPGAAAELEHAVVLQRRAVRRRGISILRARTRVRLQPGRGAVKEEKTEVEVWAEETVTWLYADRTDVGVEARCILHRQRWQRAADGHWILAAVEAPSEPPAEAAEPPVHPPQPPAVPSVAGGMSVIQPLFTRCTHYDRVRVQRYADLWWNGHNPDFPVLAADSANFASQCLLAGNMPSRRTDGGGGWWCAWPAGGSGTPGWSDSWGSADRLCAYLLQEAGGELASGPRELKVGDLVFYDWNGQGFYQHVAVVTDFDGRGDPLVNAHAAASFRRHFLYLDSPAWTPRTRYAFVHLPDAVCYTGRG
ncbi:hypothetical protein GCM10010885_23710 [Alicyclobacillus cellulosilyticus]|uniref:Putative amidase domain-containing protein n=1 Tax=Alicyclobacillus cellulosilyticus TaxID=1003997 RepID=A0A917NNJ6_9BACL|nr:amidase domain-containing protein [Alicyclobacillus cellulosilyticus]GGJ13655.1 hypothetical protein GCM10010885_23710 [Alicyclobacillus cellulosilyticus]